MVPVTVTAFIWKVFRVVAGNKQVPGPLTLDFSLSLGLILWRLLWFVSWLIKGSQTFFFFFFFLYLFEEFREPCTFINISANAAS